MDKLNWYTVLLGAVGAIAAIFLKEVVQAALKRQILLGQLDAYVTHWTWQAVRIPIAAQIYGIVKEREQRLFSASIKGKQEALDQISANNRTRDEAREHLKSEVEKAASSSEGLLKNPATSAFFSIGSEIFAINRQYLMEGKSFLSDSDSAQLGPAIASCVVSFRASTFQMFMAFEGLIRSSAMLREGRSGADFLKVASGLLDSLIMDGEHYLTSLIRLENNLQRARNRNLLQHCWDILRGK